MQALEHCQLAQTIPTFVRQKKESKTHAYTKLTQEEHSGFISENVTRASKRHIREILEGNMKIHVTVYEEGLFDLRGSIKGGHLPPPP